MLANKSDIEGAMTSAQIRQVHPLLPTLNNADDVQALELDSIKSHAWKIQACSAKTGENLLEGFDWVTKEVSNRLYYGTAIGWSAVVDTGPMEGLKEFVPLESAIQ